MFSNFSYCVQNLVLSSIMWTHYLSPIHIRVYIVIHSDTSVHVEHCDKCKLNMVCTALVCETLNCSLCIRKDSVFLSEDCVQGW